MDHFSLRTRNHKVFFGFFHSGRFAPQVSAWNASGFRPGVCWTHIGTYLGQVWFKNILVLGWSIDRQETCHRRIIRCSHLWPIRTTHSSRSENKQTFKKHEQFILYRKYMIQHPAKKILFFLHRISLKNREDARTRGEREYTITREEEREKREKEN